MSFCDRVNPSFGVVLNEQGEPRRSRCGGNMLKNWGLCVFTLIALLAVSVLPALGFQQHITKTFEISQWCHVGQLIFAAVWFINCLGIGACASLFVQALFNEYFGLPQRFVGLAVWLGLLAFSQNINRTVAVGEVAAWTISGLVHPPASLVSVDEPEGP